MTDNLKPEGFIVTSDMNNDKKVGQSILANQLALVLNESIKHTNRYKGSLKYRLNNVIEELIKAEQNEFDVMFEKHESAVGNVYDEIAEMIAEIAKLGVHHSQNVTDMLRAFQRDPASIAGIVNKINRAK